MNQERRTRERRRAADRRANSDRQRNAAQKKSIATLVILTALSTLAFVGFMLYQSGAGSTIDWGKLLYDKNKPVRDFQLGGIELGMSPEMVESKHPNMDLTSLVRGEKIATFESGGARYTVWFVAVNGRNKAYRIRNDRIIKGKTETDILEEIGRRHGKPGASDCTKGAQDKRRCHFQWWPSGGIALNVMSTTERRAGQPVTSVTMIATDTYLDSKRIRNQNQQ